MLKNYHIQPPLKSQYIRIVGILLKKGFVRAENTDRHTLFQKVDATIILTKPELYKSNNISKN